MKNKIKMNGLTEKEARDLLLTKRPTFQICTTYLDPDTGKKFCVINFIPSKDSVPDESGVYGFIKVRAVTNTVVEAEEASTKLIMNVDQFAPNIICEMGRPIQLYKTAEEYEKILPGESVKLVNENYSNSRSKFIKTQKENEQAARKEIEDRQRALEVGEDVNDDLYVYSMSISKIVSWIGTAKDLDRAHKELIEKIRAAREKIRAATTVSPEFAVKYLSFIRDKERETGLVEGKDPEMDKVIATRQEKLENWEKDVEKYLDLFGTPTKF